MTKPVIPLHEKFESTQYNACLAINAGIRDTSR